MVMTIRKQKTMRRAENAMPGLPLEESAEPDFDRLRLYAKPCATAALQIEGFFPGATMVALAASSQAGEPAHGTTSLSEPRCRGHRNHGAGTSDLRRQPRNEEPRPLSRSGD